MRKKVNPFNKNFFFVGFSSQFARCPLKMPKDAKVGDMLKNVVIKSSKNASTTIKRKNRKTKNTKNSENFKTFILKKKKKKMENEKIKICST